MSEPREVIISPGLGAGIASWNEDKGYDVAECPALIEYVKNGGRDPDEAQRICEEAGVLDPDEYFCWGGLRDATVVTVQPPYMITEHDGSESVIESNEWRR